MNLIFLFNMLFLVFIFSGYQDQETPSDFFRSLWEGQSFTDRDTIEDGSWSTENGMIIGLQLPGKI